MTTRKLLEEVGKVLYGEQWQSALARDLEVQPRTVQRWLAGDRDVPDLGAELRALIQRRRRQLDAIEAKL